MAVREIERELCEKIDKRHGRMVEKKHDVIEVWKLIAQHLIPQLENTMEWDSTRPYQKYGRQIFDGTALSAARIQAVGLQGHTMNERFRWLNYGFPIKELDDDPRHKQFLEDREEVLYATFRRSNLYSVATRMYMHAGTIGTACIHPRIDYEKQKIVYRLLHPREFYIEENEDRVVDVIHRRFKLPARRAVVMPGWEAKLSDKVKDAARNNPDQLFDFLHAVYPNEGRKYGSYLATDKPFTHVYKEFGESQYLEAGGSDRFDYFVWRWYLLDDGPYGASPAWDALFDVMGLNKTGRDMREMFHKMAFPPMVAKQDTRGVIDFEPGGVSLVQDMADKPEQVIQNIRADGPIAHVQDVRSIIERHFNVPFFLMLDQLEGVQPRNQMEMLERRTEKAVMLGPAIGTLHSAVLRPVVEDADARLEENGELPAPPESLRQYEGLDLKVDFMSPLAEAQERLVYQGVDAFLATMQALAQPGMFGPDILDHVNDRELVEALSNRDSVPPMFLNTKDDVMRLRQEKAARLAAQQQTEQEMQGAETLNKLSKAPEEGSPAEALLGG